MTIADLKKAIEAKKSFLCIGLDTDLYRIPLSFKRFKNPALAFNEAVIEATSDLCVSYKINTAFYEAQGVEGWITMQKTLDRIPQNIFTIADAKRGDIGNTATQYAKTFFETLPFDSVTLSPYMGLDTLEPFSKYSDKTLIVLGLTSNAGATDFEKLKLASGDYLFEEVMTKIADRYSADNTMFVVGATQDEQMKSLRKRVPDHFFLVPGVGAQGGSLESVFANGRTNDVGLLVNVSRGVLYAGNDQPNPSKGIREAAENYQSQMQTLMTNVS